MAVGDHLVGEHLAHAVHQRKDVHMLLAVIEKVKSKSEIKRWSAQYIWVKKA